MDLEELLFCFKKLISSSLHHIFKLHVLDKNGHVQLLLDVWERCGMSIVKMMGSV